MLKIYLTGIFIFLSSVSLNSQDNDRSLKLWYGQPAERWLEALPVGNGRLGAMVFAGIKEERIALNETTFWSGAPSDEHENPESPEAFRKDLELAILKLPPYKIGYNGQLQEWLNKDDGGIAGAQQNIFVIDGNTSGTAGIAEMLLQSHNDEIQLLPALPDTWSSGSVRGLKARGGYTVDIDWSEGKVKKYRVSSTVPGEVRIRINGEMKTIKTKRL